MNYQSGRHNPEDRALPGISDQKGQGQGISDYKKERNRCDGGYRRKREFQGSAPIL